MTAGAPTAGTASLPVPQGAQGPALSEFMKHVGDFANDLWFETERIEAGQNPTGAVSQFTPAMVRRASSRVRLNELAKPRKLRLKTLVSSLIGTLAGVVTGVASNDFGASNWATATLPAAAVIALVCVAYNHVKGDS